MRFLLPLLLSALFTQAATQISLVATQFVLPNPWTYSTDSDSPEGAWVAPLHTQSSISATVSLGQTLAPGTYAVYLKALDYDRGNSNLVVLGGTTSPLNVFNDRDTTTGYWSTNVNITTLTPASSVIVNFYSGSVGDPHQLRWFAMYITSLTNEIVLRDDRAITFTFTNAVDSSTTLGNLIPNSSFEGGVNRFWRVNSQPADGIPRTYTLQDCLETNITAFHGQQCIKLGTRTDTSIFSLRSNPIMCASNRVHTFSVYARSSSGNNLVNLYVRSFYTAPSGYTTTFTTNTSTTVGTTWTRVTLPNVFCPYYPNGQYHLIIETRGGVGGGSFTYFDAMQFQEGAAPTTYAPQSDWEVGPTLSERTQVIWDTDSPIVTLRAFNNTAIPVTKAVSYTLYNWTNGISWSGTTNMTASPSNFTSVNLTVPVTQKGHFRFVTGVTNQAGDDELTWSVVKAPPTLGLDTNSYFGGHMNADTNTIWRNQRLGVKKQRGLSLGRVRWSETELTPGVFTYPSSFDYYTNGGMSIMLTLGENNPTWFTNSWENTNGSFARFVTNVLDHFRGMVWGAEIWNEPNQDQGEVPNLNHYAVLLNQSADAIKAFIPSVQVIGGGGLSTYQMVTNVWALCTTHTNHIDRMSVHLYPPNEFSAQDLSAFTAVPLINSETGYPDKGGYAHANFPFRNAGHSVIAWKDGDPFYDASWNSIELQAKNLLTCLGWRIKDYFYYDMGQRNIQPQSFDEVQFTSPDYDDSPKPKAVMLSGIFSLLDKSVGQGIWSFGSGSATAYGYLRSLTPLVAIWATSNKNVTFTGVDTNDLIIYDVMGNGRVPHSLVVPIGKMPILIEGQGSFTIENLSNAVLAAAVTVRADTLPPTLVKVFPKTHRAVDTFRWFAVDDSGVPGEDNGDVIQYRTQVNGGVVSDWSQTTALNYEGLALPTVLVQARDQFGNISGDSLNPTNVIAKAKGRVRIIGDNKLK